MAKLSGKRSEMIYGSVHECVICARVRIAMLGGGSIQPEIDLILSNLGRYAPQAALAAARCNDAAAEAAVRAMKGES